MTKGPAWEASSLRRGSSESMKYVESERTGSLSLQAETKFRLGYFSLKNAKLICSHLVNQELERKILVVVDRSHELLDY